MMMAMAWMVMAMMMYFMRPNSLRGEPQGKPQGRSTFFSQTKEFTCWIQGRIKSSLPAAGQFKD